MNRASLSALTLALLLAVAATGCNDRDKAAEEAADRMEDKADKVEDATDQ